MSMGGSSNSGKGGGVTKPVGNIYDWSTAGLAGAGAMTGAAGETLSRGMDSTPNHYSTTGYTAAGVDSMALPDRIRAGMGVYQNPYENEVINRSLADVDRMNNMQLRSVGDAATNAGAFGGARHGLVEATTNAESQRVLGDLASKLRHGGFTTAADLATRDVANAMTTGQVNAGLGQFNASALNAAREFGATGVNNARRYGADVANARDLSLADDRYRRAMGMIDAGQAASNLGVTGFQLGDMAQKGQMDAGTLQQRLVQAIMGGAAGQFDTVNNQPQNMLDLALASLGMSPLNNNQTTTSSYTPGLFDWASLLGQTAAGMYGNR